ncbi:hypothetical protein ACM66B_002781 [Microbotryomycetes sp. NB124-2]
MSVPAGVPGTSSLSSNTNGVVGPPRLTNTYYLRTVGTPKQCFICHKETTLCLANKDVSDFMYTCQSHLLDPGFAKPVVSESTPSSPKPNTESTSPSRAEIDKVTQEYKDKHKDKSEETKATTTTTTATGVATSLFKTGLSAMSSLATTTHDHLFGPGSEQNSTATTPPTGEALRRQQALNAKVFTLHRDIFKMRQDQMRQIYYKKQAKTTMERVQLPSVPKTLPG